MFVGIEVEGCEPHLDRKPSEKNHWGCDPMRFCVGFYYGFGFHIVAVFFDQEHAAVFAKSMNDTEGFNNFHVATLVEES